MEWEHISEQRPVKDENGGRPARDSAGRPRDIEEVPIEGLDFELMIDEDATVRDRRMLHTALRKLAEGGGFSYSHALDYDVTLLNICTKFVTGLRVDGQEIKGEQAGRSLADALEYDESVKFLNWLQRRMTLTPEKKRIGSRDSAWLHSRRWRGARV